MLNNIVISESNNTSGFLKRIKNDNADIKIREWCEEYGLYNHTFKYYIGNYNDVIKNIDELFKYNNKIIKDNYTAVIFYKKYIIKLTSATCNRNNNVIKIDVLYGDDINEIDIFNRIDFDVHEYITDNNIIFNLNTGNHVILDKYKHDNIIFGFDVDEYINDFMKSDKLLLILYGEPGCGKSSFCKVVLNKSNNYRDMYSSTDTALQEDKLYDSLERDEANVVVIDNAYKTISNEFNNENIVNTLLSYTSGVFNNKTKIILCTNIENRTDITSALIRPGRAYDVKEFKPYDKSRVKEVCEFYGYEYNDEEYDEYTTMAEFFSKHNNDVNTKNTVKKVGFIK